MHTGYSILSQKYKTLLAVTELNCNVLFFYDAYIIVMSAMSLLTPSLVPQHPSSPANVDPVCTVLCHPLHYCPLWSRTLYHRFPWKQSIT